MNFAFLSMTQVAGIFAAAAVFATALYILKLRRRTVPVPFSKLWERILRDKEATSLFSRLKRLLSLLVQLALLALLAIALGDPRAEALVTKGGKNLVVLVDASASMQATDVGTSRLASAKDEVKKVIRGLGGSDRMLVAQMDAAITPLGPMSGDTSELERALDSIKATDARADFPRALRFATDSLRGLSNPEIRRRVRRTPRRRRRLRGQGPHRRRREAHLRPDRPPPRATSASRRSRCAATPLDKSRYEVMLEVTNTGPEQEDIELSLLGDNTLVDLTKLRLKPGERLPRFYPNLSGASRTLEAKISPLPGSKDSPPRRRPRVRAAPRATPREGARRVAGQHVSRGRAPARRVPRRPGRFAEGLRREDRTERRQAGRHHLRRRDRPRIRRAPTPSISTRVAPARR